MSLLGITRTTPESWAGSAGLSPPPGGLESKRHSKGKTPTGSFVRNAAIGEPDLRLPPKMARSENHFGPLLIDQ
jgi:hypothetical protein